MSGTANPIGLKYTCEFDTDSQISVDERIIVHILMQISFRFRYSLVRV